MYEENNALFTFDQELTEKLLMRILQSKTLNAESKKEFIACFIKLQREIAKYVALSSNATGPIGAAYLEIQLRKIIGIVDEIKTINQKSNKDKIQEQEEENNSVFATVTSRIKSGIDKLFDFFTTTTSGQQTANPSSQSNPILPQRDEHETIVRQYFIVLARSMTIKIQPDPADKYALTNDIIITSTLEHLNNLIHFEKLVKAKPKDAETSELLQIIGKDEDGFCDFKASAEQQYHTNVKPKSLFESLLANLPYLKPLKTNFDKKKRIDFLEKIAILTGQADPNLKTAIQINLILPQHKQNIYALLLAEQLLNLEITKQTDRLNKSKSSWLPFSGRVSKQHAQWLNFLTTKKTEIVQKNNEIANTLLQQIAKPTIQDSDLTKKLNFIVDNNSLLNHVFNANTAQKDQYKKHLHTFVVEIITNYAQNNELDKIKKFLQLNKTEAWASTLYNFIFEQTSTLPATRKELEKNLAPLFEHHSTREKEKQEMAKFIDNILVKNIGLKAFDPLPQQLTDFHKLLTELAPEQVKEKVKVFIDTAIFPSYSDFLALLSYHTVKVIVMDGFSKKLDEIDDNLAIIQNNSVYYSEKNIITPRQKEYIDGFWTKLKDQWNQDKEKLMVILTQQNVDIIKNYFLLLNKIAIKTSDPALINEYISKILMNVFQTGTADKMLSFIDVIIANQVTLASEHTVIVANYFVENFAAKAAQLNQWLATDTDNLTKQHLKQAIISAIIANSQLTHAWAKNEKEFIQKNGTPVVIKDYLLNWAYQSVANAEFATIYQNEYPNLENYILTYQEIYAVFTQAQATLTADNDDGFKLILTLKELDKDGQKLADNAGFKAWYSSMLYQRTLHKLNEMTNQQSLDANFLKDLETTTQELADIKKTQRAGHEDIKNLELAQAIITCLQQKTTQPLLKSNDMAIFFTTILTLSQKIYPLLTEEEKTELRIFASNSIKSIIEQMITDLTNYQENSGQTETYLANLCILTEKLSELIKLFDLDDFALKIKLLEQIKAIVEFHQTKHTTALEEKIPLLATLKTLINYHPSDNTITDQNLADISLQDLTLQINALKNLEQNKQLSQEEILALNRLITTGQHNDVKDKLIAYILTEQAGVITWTPAGKETIEQFAPKHNKEYFNAWVKQVIKDKDFAKNNITQYNYQEIFNQIHTNKLLEKADLSNYKTFIKANLTSDNEPGIALVGALKEIKIDGYSLSEDAEFTAIYTGILLDRFEQKLDNFYQFPCKDNNYDQLGFNALVTELESIISSENSSVQDKAIQDKISQLSVKLLAKLSKQLDIELTNTYSGTNKPAITTIDFTQYQNDIFKLSNNLSARLNEKDLTLHAVELTTFTDNLIQFHKKNFGEQKLSAMSSNEKLIYYHNLHNLLIQLNKFKQEGQYGNDNIVNQLNLSINELTKIIDSLYQNYLEAKLKTEAIKRSGSGAGLGNLTAGQEITTTLTLHKTAYEQLNSNETIKVSNVKNWLNTFTDESDPVNFLSRQYILENAIFAENFKTSLKTDKEKVDYFTAWLNNALCDKHFSKKNLNYYDNVEIINLAKKIDKTALNTILNQTKLTQENFHIFNLIIQQSNPDNDLILFDKVIALVEQEKEHKVTIDKNLTLFLENLDHFIENALSSYNSQALASSATNAEFSQEEREKIEILQTQHSQQSDANLPTILDEKIKFKLGHLMYNFMDFFSGYSIKDNYNEFDKFKTETNQVIASLMLITTNMKYLDFTTEEREQYMQHFATITAKYDDLLDGLKSDDIPAENKAEILEIYSELLKNLTEFSQEFRYINGIKIANKKQDIEKITSLAELRFLRATLAIQQTAMQIENLKEPTPDSPVNSNTSELTKNNELIKIYKNQIQLLEKTEKRAKKSMKRQANLANNQNLTFPPPKKPSLEQKQAFENVKKEIQKLNKF